MNRFRWLPLAGCLGLALLFLSGCSESVQTYEVPYVKQRLLGAFIQTNDGLWAIKLMGNADDVAAHNQEFEQFVKSIRLTEKGKDQISWTAPPAWDGEKGSGMRHTTFRLPKNLEVAVFYFQGGGGGLVQNVNRWRDQLKLAPVATQDELDRVLRDEKLASGQQVYLLDLEGARTAPLPEEPGDSESPLKFKKPEGWVEERNTGQFAMVAFTVADGGKKARVTVTAAGGDLDANVNRWRGEVGLPEQTEAEVQKSLRSTTVVGHPAFLVELTGPQGKSTLGVICPIEDASLFVKMMGDSELVAKQKPAFEAFVASLKTRGRK